MTLELDYNICAGGNRTGNGCGDFWSVIQKDKETNRATLSPHATTVLVKDGKGKLAEVMNAASRNSGIPLAESVVKEFERLEINQP